MNVSIKGSGILLKILGDKRGIILWRKINRHYSKEQNRGRRFACIGMPRGLSL